MFHTKRRKLLFVASTILPVASITLALYIKSKSPSNQVIGAFLLGILLLSAIIAWYSHIQPLREVSSAVTALLDAVGGRVIDLGKSDGIDPRMNYLALYRPWRGLFLRRFFRVRWGIGMRFSPDNAAEFHISKGIAGAAVKRRRALLIDLEEPKNQHGWNFSSDELTGFPAFTAIWSLPIFELDRGGNATGKILGTINLDATAHGAFRILSSNMEYAELLEEFQDLVSKVASC